MKIEQARVVEQVEVSGGYRVLTVAAGGIAAEARPGQFVHVRPPRLADAALRRPFSVFDAGPGRLRILYKRVGRGTQALSETRPGETLDVMGPLGNGFPLPGRPDCVPALVAGGYGVAPLHFLASRMPARGVAFLGGASAEHILCDAALRAMGWEVRVATEDGSVGQTGLVTDALDRWLEERGDGAAAPEFYACGPDGMLREVARRAARRGWTAWVSLERRMGCGVGACLTCVARVRAGGREQWARVCRDGPVFRADEVLWDEGEAAPAGRGGD